MKIDKELIEALDLRETDRTIGSSFLEELPIYQIGEYPLYLTQYQLRKTGGKGDYMLKDMVKEDLCYVFTYRQSEVVSLEFLKDAESAKDYLLKIFHVQN